jgi:adenylate cyclase
LEDADLAALVERFEAVSADVVAATGATLVKTVGDEILFVADDAVTAAETALGLHGAHARDPDVPEMRIGLASGPVLRRMGDVFGSTVNLASRLTALARPDSTLVDAATAAQLSVEPGMGLRQLAPRRVRGLGVIRVFELGRT